MTPLPFLPLVAVIPAYQAEATIEHVVTKTLLYVSEVWVGDDGSLDRTAHLARKTGAKVIRFETNQGKGAMLRALFQSVKGLPHSAVVTLDADGQHFPEDIPAFWQRHRQFPHALLLGDRDLASIPFVRRRANQIASRILSYLSGCAISDSQCGMRLIPYDILSRVETFTPRFVMETEFLWETLKAGFEVHSIPLAAYYPEDWQSHFQGWQDSREIAFYLMRIMKSALGRVSELGKGNIADG